MWLAYMGTITNIQIVLNTQKNPYLIQAILKTLKLKISNPKKSIDHPCHLKSGVPYLGLV